MQPLRQSMPTATMPMMPMMPMMPHNQMPYMGMPYGHPYMPPYGAPGYHFNPYNTMPQPQQLPAIKPSSPKSPKQSFSKITNNMESGIDRLKSSLLPNAITGGHGAFPDDFIFRQNDFRSEDLEVEERALLSLGLQEYDNMRVLSNMPVNSELYRYKMDQYKEASTIRSEVEKVLQEQRLEKIRRDFEKNKYEDERRYRHETWLEDQKRDILEAKLKNQSTNSEFQRNNSMPDIHRSHNGPGSVRY